MSQAILGASLTMLDDCARVPKSSSGSPTTMDRVHAVAMPDQEVAVSRGSAKPSLYRPRILTIIVLMIVAVPVVVANLSHDKRPPIEDGKGWPPPNPAYGWPLIWYWCEFTPSSPQRIGGGVATQMHPELVEWSGPRLAGNVAIWLLIFGVVGFACQWFLRRYGPGRTYRPRILTLVVLALVAAPTVLANLSGDDVRWPRPAQPRGWPLTWHWRDWQHWYGASTQLDYNFGAARLTVNLAVWVVMLAATGAVCEWLLRRYQPRFRWSLRTMLAAVALLAVLCGWGVALRERAKLQDPIIAMARGILSTGPLFLYVEHCGPKWLDLLGVERFCWRVVGAQIRQPEDGCEEILKLLAQTPNLQYLGIDVRNPAAGDASALAQMRRLRALRINGDSYTSQNVLSQDYLEAVAKLSRLEELHLGGTTDSGNLACLAGLTNLRSLSLQMRCNAATTVQLPALPRLETLDIRSVWGNSIIDDPDLRQLAILPRLKSLNLSDSDITDEGLAELASLESLEELAIGHDMVTPTGLRSLLALKRLKALHVKRYAIVTREVLAALPFQKSLKHMENSEEGLSEAESSVVEVLELLNGLRGKGDRSQDESGRLTTVELGHGARILALESEVDDFRHALEALRQAQPGIVIDSDPKWFDQKRGEKTEELFWPPGQGSGMF